MVRVVRIREDAVHAGEFGLPVRGQVDPVPLLLLRVDPGLRRGQGRQAGRQHADLRCERPGAHGITLSTSPSRWAAVELTGRASRMSRSAAAAPTRRGSVYVQYSDPYSPIRR